MGTACVIRFVRVLTIVTDSLVATVFRTLIAVLTGVAIVEITMRVLTVSIASASMVLLQNAASGLGAGNAAFALMVIILGTAVFVTLSLQTADLVCSGNSGIVGAVGSAAAVILTIFGMGADIAAVLALVAKGALAAREVVCICILRNGLGFDMAGVIFAGTLFCTCSDTGSSFKYNPIVPIVVQSRNDFGMAVITTLSLAG